MDWRFNTIWFEQLEQSKIFGKNFKENEITTQNKNFVGSEYATIWHLKEKARPFDDLLESDKLLYLELIWANIRNFDGIEKFPNLKRLELHYCVKLENDIGLSHVSSLEFLCINQAEKFLFSDELIQLKNLKVLCLNSCGPIESLDFLKNFPSLIDFRFVNTNILDGNINPILEHPTIKTVGFLDKKHYNRKSKEVLFELESRCKEQYKNTVYKGQYSTFRYDYN